MTNDTRSPHADEVDAAEEEDAYRDVPPETLILRDHLAADRTVLANERTFLAYLRTAFAFVVGGASLAHFIDRDWALAAGWAMIPVGAVLLNMAVFGAVIAYIMQMAAFVLLRRDLPHIERPYVSPLGNAGAVVSGTIAAVTLVCLFLNPDYRVGVYGCAVWFAAGITYFGTYGRHRLIYSPEEEFAVRARGDSGR